MIDHLLTIDRNAIMSMNSTRTSKIALPYANTSDICYHAGEMLAEHIGTIGSYPDTAEGDRQLSKDTTVMLDHSKITAYLMLQPSRIQPRAGLAIDVTTPDGQRLHRTLYAPSGSKAVAEIISKFLAAGALGLRGDVRQSYERQHCEFMWRLRPQSARIQHGNRS